MDFGSSRILYHQKIWRKLRLDCVRQVAGPFSAQVWKLWSLLIDLWDIDIVHSGGGIGNGDWSHNVTNKHYLRRTIEAHDDCWKSFSGRIKPGQLWTSCWRKLIPLARQSVRKTVAVRNQFARRNFGKYRTCGGAVMKVLCTLTTVCEKLKRRWPFHGHLFGGLQSTIIRVFRLHCHSLHGAMGGDYREDVGRVPSKKILLGWRTRKRPSTIATSSKQK